MASKKRDHYRYRQHQIVLNGDNWQINGPAYTGTTRTIRQAIEAIDKAPDAPRKASKREAGRLGAATTWSRYNLIPYGTSDFAMVRRDTGEIIAYQSGRRF